MKRYRIGKVYISATSPSDAICSIKDRIKKNSTCYICVSNLRMIRYASTDILYQKLMYNSFMNLPDGMPLTWCGKLWGEKNIACTNGPRLFKTMLEKGDNSIRHFLLGDTEEVLASLKNKYTEDFGTNIVGTYSPPFADIEDFNYEEIAKLINEANADIIWTAMRAPKQDYFNQRLCRFLNRGVCIGVGRAFRVALGEFAPVPDWAKKMGLSGIYMRRKSLLVTLWWYFQSAFFLLYYMSQIIYLRIKGQK